MDASTIIKAVMDVTKKWTKQRKREERESNAAARRREALTRCHRVTIKEAAYEAMEAAYRKASGVVGMANPRQIYYVARPTIQARTGKVVVDGQYFAQTLLPDFMAENPKTCANWDIVWDDRGHFAEPHTGKIVGLGTLAVRKYLASLMRDDDLSISVDKLDYPTCGSERRFGAVLFIEKEGFLPLFEAVHLAERFDIAIMSSKGLSTTAARTLIDRLCGEHHIRLLVLRDFDKSGFSIVGTLCRDTRRYSFKNKVEVIDLGLRLEDVRKHQLQSERVAYGKSDPAPNLRENGATEAEIEFLCSERTRTGYFGYRVELNSFISDSLIAFVEGDLKKHGIKKVVPDAATLERAFRRAATIAKINEALPELVEKAQREAGNSKVRANLGREVQRKLRDNPAMPWDKAIAGLAGAELA